MDEMSSSVGRVMCAVSQRLRNLQRAYTRSRNSYGYNKFAVSSHCETAQKSVQVRSFYIYRRVVDLDSRLRFSKNGVDTSSQRFVKQNVKFMITMVEVCIYNWM
jgi:hypothetical protein